jgi:Zn-finger nucleic acid-binding protein
MSSQRCPKCRVVSLSPAPEGVVVGHSSEAVLECTGCRGLWVPHRALEEGVELNITPVGGSPTPSIPPEEDHRTGLCPDGHGILIRARADLDRSFHVERCPLCRGIWLDRGEYRRLVAAGLLAHLDDLWDPQWRRRQREGERRRRLDCALQQQLGEDLFGRLETVVLQLQGHEARSQALAWITDHLEGKDPTDGG